MSSRKGGIKDDSKVFSPSLWKKVLPLTKMDGLEKTGLGKHLEFGLVMLPLLAEEPTGLSQRGKVGFTAFPGEG